MHHTKRGNLGGELVISMAQTDKKRVKLTRGGILTTTTVDEPAGDNE